MRKVLLLGVAAAAVYLSSSHGTALGLPAIGSAHVHGGTLNCAGLERLWEAAGGSPSAAFTAAEVAMAESGGHQFTPDNSAMNNNGQPDVGYWQINEGYHPGLATTDPIGNAKAAIQISRDGTDWSPWVTYSTGAYQGKC